MNKNVVHRIGLRGLIAFSLLCLVALASFVTSGLLSNPSSANAQIAATGTTLAHLITVTGQADYTVKPDTAYIYENVSAQAVTAADAISATNNSLNALTAKLKADGVADADLQAGGVNVFPMYGVKPGIGAPINNSAPTQTTCVKTQPNCGSNPTVTGYRGNVAITVRINDLTLLPTVLSDSVAIGNVSVSNTNYTTKDSSTQRNAALTQAVQNSRSQADAIAAGLGVKITGVSSVNTNAGYTPYNGPQGMGSGVVAGPLTQYVTVSVSYSFS